MHKPIAVDRCYSAEEFDQLKKGFIPQDMDEKWFVYYEEPYLYLHRSWTGFCLYRVELDRGDDGVRISEALVNRDPDQYGGTDDIGDTLRLTALLDFYAGRKDRSAWDQFFARQSGE